MMEAGVERLVDRYLSLVDQQAPGLVEGCYLTGSVALDDYRPGVSDVDFVTVTRQPLSGEALVAVGRAHTALGDGPAPSLDGWYVTWDDLAHDPAAAGQRPRVHEGRFDPDGNAADPITWQILATRGVAVRGPGREQVEVLVDRELLAGWLHGNLDSYWRPWLRRSRRLLSRPGVASLTPWGPVWGVLGVSRIHCTLATGEIVSKRRAGEYAQESFDPRWRRIVTEALRLRCGEGGARYRSRFARRRDTLDFVEMAIGSARAVG